MGFNKNNNNGQKNLGIYTYQSSTVGDVIGDTRFSNSSGWFIVETCTVANAVKGAGTWIKSKALKSISLSDSNMVEGSGSYIDLDSSKSGFGRIVIGNSQEYADFIFMVDGSIILLSQCSSNVVTTSTDGKLVIRDAGSNVRIVNELGTTLTATITIDYNI